MALLEPDRFAAWLQRQYGMVGSPRSEWTNPLACYLHDGGASLYVNRVCAFDLRRIVVMLPGPFAGLMADLARIEQEGPVKAGAVKELWRTHARSNRRPER